MNTNTPAATKAGRPIILMTLSNADDDSFGRKIGDTQIVYSDKATAAAIIQAGGVPLYAPTLNAAAIEDYLAVADGVLITGANSNVNPALYGEQRIPSNDRMDDARDQADVRLIRLTLDRQLPLLGICKGMQIINVALGGSLYQEVSSQHPSHVTHNQRGKRTEVTHSATLAGGSLLHKLAGADRISLKGGHQQAVKRLAPTLLASAIADDGIIEAYEATPEYPFMLGIQFHAELRLDEPFCKKIFKTFVTSAATCRKRRT